MKVHISVDAGTSCVHTLTATAANVHNVEKATKLVREDDEHLKSMALRIVKRHSSLKTTELFQ